MSIHRTRFVREDAWLLVAATEYAPRSRPRKLWELLHDYDWLNRAIPTYHQLSYGLARLVAAGYITVRKGMQSGVTIRATDEGWRLGTEARGGARTLTLAVPRWLWRGRCSAPARITSFSGSRVRQPRTL